MSALSSSAPKSFVTNFKRAYATPYNPVTQLRKMSEGLASKLANIAPPKKGLYQSGVKTHVLRMAMQGPRQGARYGGLVAKGLCTIIESPLQTPKAPMPKTPKALNVDDFVEDKRSTTRATLKTTGALTGGMLGLATASLLQAAVGAGALLAIGAGCLVGLVAGTIIAGGYGVGVFMSREVRDALNKNRMREREQGHAALRDLPSIELREELPGVEASDLSFDTKRRQLPKIETSRPKKKK